MSDGITFSYKKFNPNFHHLNKALKNDDLRYIFLQGGSSSSKSFSLAQNILIDCLRYGNNTLVYRKVGASIKDSIYNTFKEASESLTLTDFFKFTINRIQSVDIGSVITFKGLDDPEKIKGIESYKYVVLEELTEFAEADLKQIKKRLRGRAGQKIIGLFNPVSEQHWIKKNIFDKETLVDVNTDMFGTLKSANTGEILPKEYSEIAGKQINSSRMVFNPRTGENEIHQPDMLIMRSTHLNNFWVVGSPDGSFGYYD